MAEQLAFDFNAPLATLPQLWTPDDIFNSLNAETIGRFREDGRLERKRVEVSQKDLGDYVAMWANTQPSGGIVFIGVDDLGKIIGCKHADIGHLNDLEQVRRRCPDAKLEFKRVSMKNHKGEDDFVIGLRVHYRADKLVETNSGTAFVREGDEKRELTETEKHEIRLNKGELDVESERVPLAFPADFDQGLMEQFRSNFIAKRALKDRFTVTDVLNLAKLGKHGSAGFEPNLACALLFARDPRVVVPGAFVRVIRYDGTEEQFGKKMNTIASFVAEGPLPLQIVHAEEFIRTQIRSFTRLGRDGRFETKPEYPKDVWLEAIVNAVVHRSYNLRHMNIFVKMFEDKIVVESPGAFLPPTTSDTVFDAHNPRNPNLMWALYYFDYVQCAFEGTRRMRQGMRDANLPDPLFVQKQSGTFQVSVTLENNLQHRKQYVRAEASSAISAELYAGLSEPEKMIVNYLTDKARVNVTEAGLIIARGWRETKTTLDELEQKGVISRIPGKPKSKHRYYFLTKSKKNAV